ncbi:MAG: GNAT family N-acetyltransferase [Muribaculaceae bacterium]
MKTKRIHLRSWRESDAEALFRYASDPEVGPRAGWQPHSSVEESRLIIESVFNNATTWAIALNDTDEAIGAIGYGESCDCALPALPGEQTVGYWVAKPYWNKGICTEALRLLVDYCFDVEGMQSLISGHFVDNPASGRVMEKCGFVATGEIAFDPTLYGGANRPIRVLRITRQNHTKQR